MSNYVAGLPPGALPWRRAATAFPGPLSVDDEFLLTNYTGVVLGVDFTADEVVTWMTSLFAIRPGESGDWIAVYDNALHAPTFATLIPDVHDQWRGTVPLFNGDGFRLTVAADTAVRCQAVLWGYLLPVDSDPY